MCNINIEHPSNNRELVGANQGEKHIHLLIVLFSFTSHTNTDLLSHTVILLTNNE